MSNDIACLLNINHAGHILVKKTRGSKQRGGFSSISKWIWIVENDPPKVNSKYLENETKKAKWHKNMKWDYMPDNEKNKATNFFNITTMV